MIYVAEKTTGSDGREEAGTKRYSGSTLFWFHVTKSRGGTYVAETTTGSDGEERGLIDIPVPHPFFGFFVARNRSELVVYLLKPSRVRK